jgi:predicted nucleic acid-binding protein
VVTAVDSSVIFDFATGDPQFGGRSKAALATCMAQGRVVACEVVWAEVAGYFPASAAAHQMLSDLGIDFDAIGLEAALEAARAWKVYRSGGGARNRVAANFLIGAHAIIQADRLLTRDRGFYRSYFKQLSILDPSKA